MALFLMHTVTVEEAQAHLGELLDEAIKGETVVITKDAETVVRLVAEPAEKATAPKGWPFLNLYKGKVTLAEGWDDPIPEEHWDVLRP